MALDGHSIGVWEVDERGRMHAIATSREGQLPTLDVRELEDALREWHVDKTAGRRWVASRLGEGRWCISPVRTVPAGPAPAGIERRSSQRMMFDLLALCVGLIAEQDRASAPQQERGPVDRERRARIAAIVDQLPVALWTTDRDLRITSRSGAGRSSTRVLPDRVVGASLVDQLARRIVGPESVDAHRRALNGESVSYQIRSADRWYDADVEPMRDQVGAVVGVVGVAMDVTDRELALDEARRSRRDLEEFFESAPIGIHWTAPDGTILRANRAELEMLGYGHEEYVGRNIAEFHVVPEILAEIRRRVSGGGAAQNVEGQLRHRSGAIRHVLISANALFDGERLVTMRSITRDITDRKVAEDRLVREALRDALTHLPNRTFFVERVDHAIQRLRRDADYRFAVVFLDFDDFKLVNDSLGHAAGDEMLVQVASRLQSFVRPGDVVARFGGDEFTLLLEDVGGASALEGAARRIINCLAAPFVVHGREIFASASVGVAPGDANYERPDDLLRDADIAMYRAKAQGRSRFQLFDVAMRDSARERFGLESDLRNALDRGELRLVFQPIVELDSGRVHALEALLRWDHPTQGVIQPLQFIPLAERTGLIVPIGAWVLREACLQARRWQEAIPGAAPVRISVNLSAIQLDSPRIADEVKEVLELTGLDPRSLGLEITESVLVENEETSIAILERLRRLKVELHMDDFGTGYSSLSRLPRFPLDKIKIDRSFVHRIGARHTDLEIVRSIVELAKNVGLGVVAEGVETAAQLERLRALGCEFGQGFHFARPLDAAGVAVLLEADARRTT
ncbi:MAG: putative bifunctional diguanylate cyclase/phosphodiesterase [Gemmatimonadales bacterium]